MQAIKPRWGAATSCLSLCSFKLIKNVKTLLNQYWRKIWSILITTKVAFHKVFNQEGSICHWTNTRKFKIIPQMFDFLWCTGLVCLHGCTWKINVINMTYTHTLLCRARAINDCHEFFFFSLKWSMCKSKYWQKIIQFLIFIEFTCNFCSSC